MNKLLSGLIVLLFCTNSVYAAKSECTKFLYDIYPEENHPKKIISQKEYSLNYDMQLGENKISKIVYGLGYCKYGCFRKKKITYICTQDENNKPVWGQINFYE